MVLKDIIFTAFPASAAAFTEVLKETINLIFIGRLGDPVLVAGVGMGNIIVNLIGSGIYFGINSGMETLVS